MVMSPKAISFVLQGRGEEKNRYKIIKDTEMMSV